MAKLNMAEPPSAFTVAEILLNEVQSGAISYGDNLWDGSAELETWFSPADWSGGLDPQAVYADGKLTLTVPEGVGGSEWQGQVKLHTDIAIDPAKKYAFRAKIKRERMIEFMGEGKRYFDLRRWMDAPIEESMQIYGLDTYQPQSNREQFMDVIPCTKLRTVFADKMYFWPISHTELKRNKHLTQNPGWTYND